MLQFNTEKNLVFLKSTEISSQAQRETEQFANMVKCKADDMAKEGALSFQAFDCFPASEMHF